MHSSQGGSQQVPGCGRRLQLVRPCPVRCSLSITAASSAAAPVPHIRATRLTAPQRSFLPAPQLRLFVCNNDDTIKVYGLQGGTLATVLRCPVAINYCALSPSGR